MQVKKVIKEKGWTIENLAKEMMSRNGEKGVSPVTLHQNISRNPTIDTLRRIAEVIGCQVGDFFKDETTPDKSDFCAFVRQGDKTWYVEDIDVLLDVLDNIKKGSGTESTPQ